MANRTLTNRPLALSRFMTEIPTIDHDQAPTILVVHPKENRSKCSIEPLRGKSGYEFWTFPKRGPQSTAGYFRLGLGGSLISSTDSGRGLILLDATWRLADRMEREFQEFPVRSLLPWKTAYPRVSKVYPDPVGGLATIEALFAAHRQAGKPTTGLLDDYHWANQFLEINAELLALCGEHGLTNVSQ